MKVGSNLKVYCSNEHSSVSKSWIAFGLHFINITLSLATVMLRSSRGAGCLNPL